MCFQSFTSIADISLGLLYCKCGLSGVGLTFFALELMGEGGIKGRKSDGVRWKSSIEEVAFSSRDILEALSPIIEGLLFKNALDIHPANCYVQGPSTGQQ